MLPKFSVPGQLIPLLLRLRREGKHKAAYLMAVRKKERGEKPGRRSKVHLNIRLTGSPLPPTFLQPARPYIFHLSFPGLSKSQATAVVFALLFFIVEVILCVHPSHVVS